MHGIQRLALLIDNEYVRHLWLLFALARLRLRG
jgi:hypothetical protein